MVEPDSDSKISDSDSDSDSGGCSRFPLVTTDADIGITMASPPESPLAELPNDDVTGLPGDHEIFHTPTQSISATNSTSFSDCNDEGIVDGVSSSKRAVDLGGDTNSGCSGEEVDSPLKINVLKRESSPEGKSSTQFHFKSLDFESPSEPLGKIKGTSLDFSTEGVECDTENRKVECENNNNEGNSDRNTNIVEGIDPGSVKVSIKGKKLDFSTDGMECDTGKREVECENGIGGSLERNTNIVKDIDPDRYIAGNGSKSCGKKEKTKTTWVLPSLADERPEANGRAGNEDFMKISVSDLLLNLQRNDPEDRSLACLSLLEVAERRWGTF